MTNHPPGQLGLETAKGFQAARPTNAFERFAPEWAERNVLDCFKERTAVHAKHTAVRLANGDLTYRDLELVSNGVANALCNLGGSGAEPVALLLEQDAAVPAAMFGSLKAGKFYVPLDPSNPAERIQEILSDIESRLIVVDRTNLHLARSLSAPDHHVVCLEDISSADLTGPSTASIKPDHLACVLYTSGSTGKPKGVMHTHRSLLHKVMRHTNGRRISAEDRIALLFSYNFGASMTNTFSALLNGAMLAPFCLPKLGIARLAQWLQEEGITIVHTVPTIFRRLTDGLTEGLEFPNLRLIRLGGETMYRSDIERFKRHFTDHCILHLGMGSGETGVVLECFFDKNTECATDLAPTGYPAEDMTVSILDENGHDAGFERIGEIAVRGSCLSPGYWRNPELTKAVFLPGPAGDRTYLTGDLGYRLPDGCVFHVGRKDSQVKIRGSRVELGEIEAALLNMPGVKEAAAVARQDPTGRYCLAAYVALHDGSTASVQELRNALRRKLPSYMLPEGLEVLPSLPLLSSGKIDRRALPSWRPVSYPSDNPDAAQMTLVETQLCGVWKRVLGVPGVGIHDDFLDLGGDSLLALQMVSEVEELFGKRLSLSHFPNGLTIEQLSRALQNGSGHAAPPVALIQAGGSKPPLFFLHGDAESGGLYCRNLARQLGPAQPFYAIAPHGSAGAAVPKTVEAMAADFLKELADVLPPAPVLLGGFCNGGVVAFEMARQLERRGHKVLAVLMIDARNRNAEFRLAGRLRDVLAFTLRMSSTRRRNCFMRLRWYSEGLAEANAQGWSPVVRFVLAKLTNFTLASWEATARFCRRSSRSVQPERTESSSVQSADRFAALRLPLHEALEEYVPGRFAGRVILFRSRTHLARFPGDPAAGWCSVASRVEVHELSGTHKTCTTTDVAELAKKMGPYLSGGELAESCDSSLMGDGCRPSERRPAGSPETAAAR